MILKIINKILHDLAELVPTKYSLTLLKLKFNILKKRFKTRTIGVMGFRVKYTDTVSIYFEFKDIFKNKIYHFETKKRDPLIIDAGSCIGMSIIYFKHIYPDSKIIGFEPDGNIYNILQSNIKANDLPNIEVINAALSSSDGFLEFYPDGTDGGSLFHENANAVIKVPSLRLSKFIDRPIDFLKMNIEGAETEVLYEIEGKLNLINEMVIEYHSFDNSKQKLHEILELLNRNGFMYLINDFDTGTNPNVKAPFRLNKETKYFLLIYAKKCN
jgi:FkbM family methyltransferase